jgi:hypothetical protein
MERSRVISVSPFPRIPRRNVACPGGPDDSVTFDNRIAADIFCQEDAKISIHTSEARV